MKSNLSFFFLTCVFWCNLLLYILNFFKCNFYKILFGIICLLIAKGLFNINRYSMTYLSTQYIDDLSNNILIKITFIYKKLQLSCWKVANDKYTSYLVIDDCFMGLGKAFYWGILSLISSLLILLCEEY